MRWEKDIEERNRFLIDEEFDVMFLFEGYKILDVFFSYVLIRILVRKFFVIFILMGIFFY